jgi:hypothetical protein
MNATLVLLILVAFGAGLAWLLVKAHRQALADDEARALLALRRGWTYTREGRPGAAHFTIRGEHGGHSWWLACRTVKRGKHHVRLAHWCAPACATPRLTWLVCGRDRARFEGGLAGQFIGGLLSMRLPGERSDENDRQAFMQIAREVQAPGLTAEIVQLALPGAATARLDADSVPRLMTWPVPLAAAPFRSTHISIQRDARGVRIHRQVHGGLHPPQQVELRQDSHGLHVAVDGMPFDAAVCAHAIDLGLTLLASAPTRTAPPLQR